MHRRGNVYVLQVLQGFGVEKSQSGTGAEGDPDAHPGHHHVGHHHALFLMGLQLPLGGKDRTEWQNLSITGSASRFQLKKIRIIIIINLDGLITTSQKKDEK